ncbi:2TM domain-containing protein [Aquimarina sp. 2-A2]|uniref:2TM domain-containing protein n=1 Tax=Aquimarina sp. 2-A2 TaxID=3382644 RepID=UPI00387EFE9F
MFSKKKETPHIDAEQRELFENARIRILEKKRLLHHFIFFLAGAIFFIVLNLVFGFGKDIRLFDVDWFVYVILIWVFILLIHTGKVVLFSKFMGKEWTDRQMLKLVAKQKAQIEKMEREMGFNQSIPNVSDDQALDSQYGRK